MSLIRSAVRLTWLLAAVLTGCAMPRGDATWSALPPMQVPAGNPMTPAKVALGKQLFADTRLSGSGKMACQSCHFHDLGWTDALALSRRDDGVVNSRHTPTLYNVGHQTIWYWDGRSATLEGQILAAWRGQTGADPAKVAAILNTVPSYRSQFQSSFGSEASSDTIVNALASFMRSLTSDQAPWDRYERGDKGAVSTAVVEGHALFTGKARCHLCHAPPLYGGSTFFNIGLEHGKDKPDPGRFNVTRKEADRGAFKTPTLRTVQRSAPYFHDGSVASLKEAVRLMASGGKLDPNKSALLQDTGLTEAEIDKLVAFLHALTSPEAWQAPTIP